MPRVRRRSKRYADNYNEYETEHLLTGHSVFGDILDADRFRVHGSWQRHNYPLLREAWNTLGTQLMAQWIEQNPGSRPWSWWAFNSPGRRERIDGVLHPHDDPLWQTKAELKRLEYPELYEALYEMHFGIPRIPDGPDPAQYEGQLNFLDRHNLLSPFERESLYGEPQQEGEGNDATSEETI